MKRSVIVLLFAFTLMYSCLNGQHAIVDLHEFAVQNDTSNFMRLLKQMQEAKLSIPVADTMEKEFLIYLKKKLYDRCDGVKILVFLNSIYQIPFDIELFERIIECGDESFIIPLLTKQRNLLKHEDVNGNNLLMLASKSNNIDLITFLISQVNLLHTNKKGESILQIATQSNSIQLPIIKLLVEAGVNSKSSIFNTIIANREDVAIYLLNNSGHISDSDLMSYIGSALSHNMPNLVNELADRIENINITNLKNENLLWDFKFISRKYYYENPLRVIYDYDTIKSNELVMLKTLLDKGLDINHTNKKGETVMFYLHQYPHIANYLIKEKINLNIISNNRKSVLDVIIEKLIKPNSFNLNGELVSFQSEEDINIELLTIQYFIENGARLAKKNKPPLLRIRRLTKRHNRNDLLKKLDNYCFDSRH